MFDDDMCSAYDLEKLEKYCNTNDLAHCYNCKYVSPNAGYYKPDCNKLKIRLDDENIPKKCEYYKLPEPYIPDPIKEEYWRKCNILEREIKEKATRAVFRLDITIVDMMKLDRILRDTTLDDMMKLDQALSTERKEIIQDIFIKEAHK